MERIEVHEEHPDGQHHVLTVTGDLDLGTVGHLCSRVARLRERAQAADVVLDLSRLDFCDSTGLRALLGEARETEICGGHLRVVAPCNGIARRLFEVCGVDQLLDVLQSPPACSRHI
jgi:anti-sigma B factor antagonist